MKSLRFLLPLLAALLVSVGFFLPWMGAALAGPGTGPHHSAV